MKNEVQGTCFPVGESRRVDNKGGSRGWQGEGHKQ